MKRHLLWCTLLSAVAAPLHAQDSPELPDSIAELAVYQYNQADIRMTGASDIPAATTIDGSIAVLDGTLRLAGTVNGSVIVINGDLVLDGSARIGGQALVVGGLVHGDTTAAVQGVRAFPEPLRYRFDGAGIARARAPVRGIITAGRDFRFGRTDFLIGINEGYNRVEGLPLALGPRARLGHSNPSVIEALLIVRTEKPLDFNRHGWSIRAEQYMGGRRAVSFGVRVRSEVERIENLGLSNLENSLTALVLHQDYRDHYRREGWSVYTRAHHPTRPLDAMLEYRDERHFSVRAGSPFSFVDNDDEWRLEPAIDEGTLRSLTLSLAYDTRNDERNPSAGWWLQGALEQAMGGDVSRLAETFDVLNDGATDRHFSHLTLDLRRYLRFNPHARLAVRIFAAGSVDGDALPPQRQHTLGGEGTLPGYKAFAQDCGARSTTVPLRADAAYPYYGCDRAALVQMEYEGSFPYARRLGERLNLGVDLAHTIRWSLFFDAGRAWVETDARNGRLGGNHDFSADAGVGLRIGPLGIYGAVPLSGGGAHDFNVFLRIGQRL